jgi:hypothetical protein
MDELWSSRHLGALRKWTRVCGPALADREDERLAGGSVPPASRDRAASAKPQIIRYPDRYQPSCESLNSGEFHRLAHCALKTAKPSRVMFRSEHWDDRGSILRLTLLRNPFEQAPDAVPAARHHETRATRATPVCSRCQSDDITCSATVQWSNESQEWQLANTFDLPAHCNSCGNSGDLTWLPLN